MKTAAYILAALLAVSFAGCGSKANDGATDDSSVEPVASLVGFVFDPAVRPLLNVTVKVLETNSSSVTDASGRYSFERLPVEQFLIVVAELAGFKSASKQVTLPPDTTVRINFTMEPVPVEVPRLVVLPFEGFIACQTTTEVDGDNETNDCSGGQGQKDIWQFGVEPGLEGAVIEVFWEPGQPGAETMWARLETLELGKLNTVLAENRGTGSLRLAVAQEVASRYYAAGGLMRLTVSVHANTDETEVGIGAGVAVQQPFDAYASLFYVQGPDPTYTFASP